MSTFQHLHLETDSSNILWLKLDVQGESTNILTPEVLDELSRAGIAIRSHKPAGLVICSGKSTGFIAGADVKRFTEVKSTEQALAFIEKGQAVCQQFADLPCPTLAMIDGFCLGGGLELALALDYRIASDNPGTRLGLPEVKLGIHPGFGGTVRSIAKLGVLNAMDIMLSGRLLRPQAALKMGLLDYCVAERQLHSTAVQTLLKPPAKTKPPFYLSALNQLAPARHLLGAKLRKQVAEHARPEHYPAPYALIDLWEKHGGNPAAMYKAEAVSVAKLVLGDTAQNLVRVFFLQNRLKALGDKKLFQPQHVHVVGGGTMGGEIAAWCAMQGLRVSVQDQNADALARVVARASEAFQHRYKKDARAIQAALDRLIPDPHGEGIGKADVIIEAIFENLQAKRQLFAALESKAKPDAILASNTSSIPLEDIAGALREPQRLVGLHFFNPVFKMPLVEVVYDPHAKDDAVLARALAFTRHIDKLPLPVHSSPGFLVNRILMPYLLEGIRLQQQGIPAAIIDEAARDFGMPMGPLKLADTVGLDICQHVGDILARKLGLDVPLTLNHMTRAGKLGKKSGEGFYRYRNGKMMKTEAVEWQGNRTMLQTKLITPLVNEAKACLAQGIVDDADLLDAGVIFGTGFAPFRGGPLHYAQS
ncbi:MAG: 3-hydroxyacyl-CoA dehydrogenase NAD-binding domain-containing protein [Thiothrix sp.]|uniref:3-hydroxyacyl-CoA dehydrogenase NAD-binding domain-containing protein n=1 Tax=Thiothrix sp. TaxID=1032 RepID=UPI00261ECD96|nr:3-hydroxyacyl-CoA dehydrogenase NAD-binding domain-containing protein [Thiothrix sp.]MDD5392221.1 3-hydroxyacyl-CoA dehydrogenase NAD-binding domain-containing protein [Thiothrix sp.]